MLLKFCMSVCLSVKPIHQSRGLNSIT